MSAAVAPPHPTVGEGGRGRLRQLGHDSVYLLLGFPVAIISFVLMVTGLSLGAGLAITVLGFPVLVVTLHLAGVFAVLERSWLPTVLGRPVSAPTYRPVRHEAGALARVFDVLRDRQRWLEMLHGILRFPLSTATWVITVTWWALTLAGLAYPLFAWALPARGGPDNTTLADLLGFEGWYWDLAITFGIGLLAALALPWVLRGCAVAQAVVAREFLTSERSVVLQERVTELATLSRRGGVRRGQHP